MMLTPFANHLWESTILALLAGVLTLILSRQPARVRYAVWLVASVKFLIPFSWLVFAGSRLAWFRGPASGTSGLYIAIEVLSKFTPSAIASGLSRVTPVLVGLWLCGILAVFAAWGRQWRRMSAAMRAATPLREGREVEALRRMELTLGIHRPIEVRQSRVSVEPGVLGIVRPVLIWPEGISEHLDGAQLEAIVAHEAQHVRRRDNLASAIHMIVEAIFWFHPLVWWLGARLVKERERACDEGGLELGGERRASAEGILKVCEFCLTSPLDCMAGVAGGDLKKRMVSIMTEQTLQRVDFGRKLLLGTAGLAVIAGPIVLGTLHAAPTRAESSPVVAQESQQAAPDHVSQKDMSGMVVKKVQPVYPEAAKKAGIQGEVKLKATIGKNGDIENLQVMSGPAELVPSAIEAVKQWKYRPYMKNGQAAEVVTDVDVTFTLAK
jgi:bla regulator protein BlaR1